MRTESREMLAVGIFGVKSHVGDRIEMLLRRPSTFSPRASATGVTASTAALVGLMLTSSLAPRWIAFAQQPAQQSFEVASVKPSGPDEGRSISFAPGRFVATGTTLKDLVRFAYGAASHRTSGIPVYTESRIIARGWPERQKYDIEATSGSISNADEMSVMLQALLTERFRLKLRRETRRLPGFVLLVAKSGPKLQPSKSADCSTSGPPASPASGEVVSPPCGGFFSWKCRVDGASVAIANVARVLSNVLDRPVTDKTGIQGTYDIHLEWASDEVAVEPAAGPSLFTALQERLGLKLESANGPVEVLVIDHAEKPDAN